MDDVRGVVLPWRWQNVWEDKEDGVAIEVSGEEERGGRGRGIVQCSYVSDQSRVCLIE